VKKKKIVPRHPNVVLLALPLPRAADKYTKLDVDPFLSQNQLQHQLHQVDLHLSPRHRTKILQKILQSLVNQKVKRKRNIPLTLLKPRPRAKRLKLK